LTSGLLAHSMELPAPHLSPPTLKLNDSDGKVDHNLYSALDYLAIADILRASLAKGIAMYDDELEILLFVLTGILQHEAPGNDPIEFQTIVFSRLDKLIESLIGYKGKNQHSSDIFEDVIRNNSVIMP
jgi:hypothetical protein